MSEVCWQCDSPGTEDAGERPPGWCARCGFFFDRFGMRIAAEAVTLGAHVVYSRQVLDRDQLTPRQRRWESSEGLCTVGSTGAELFLEPLPGAAVVIKYRFDLWQSAQWWEYLNAHHIDALIISGVELRCCVLYAALGADEHGYAYTVPLDLVSGIDAGEATYNEWTRRNLRDVHDAPASSAECYRRGAAAWQNINLSARNPWGSRPDADLDPRSP